jgi:hypothetical protein
MPAPERVGHCKPSRASLEQLFALWLVKVAVRRGAHRAEDKHVEKPSPTRSAAPCCYPGCSRHLHYGLSICRPPCPSPRMNFSLSLVQMRCPSALRPSVCLLPGLPLMKRKCMDPFCQSRTSWTRNVGWGPSFTCLILTHFPNPAVIISEPRNH